MPPLQCSPRDPAQLVGVRSCSDGRPHGSDPLGRVVVYGENCRPDRERLVAKWWLILDRPLPAAPADTDRRYAVLRGSIVKRRYIPDVPGGDAAARLSPGYGKRGTYALI